MIKFKIAILALALSLSLCSCATKNAPTSEDNTSDSTVEEQSVNDTGDREYVTLYQNGSSCFDVVYSAKIQKDSPRMEIVKSFFSSICTALGETVGSSTAPRLMPDTGYTPDAERAVILFGETVFDESVQAVENMKIGESGFFVDDNKIVVYGIAMDELQKAGGEFINLLNESARLDDNKKPVFEISVSATQSSVKELAIAKLPKPEVKSKLLLCDAGDGSRLWVAENCTMDDFNKYVADLKDASFTVYKENQIYKNNDTNDKTKCNAYATLTKDDIIVNVWYTVDGYLKITADQGFDLIPKTPKTYQQIPGLVSGLTMIGTGQQSELLFFRLADGSFVVIDGGLGDATSSILYEALKEQAPDPNNIRIACWIFTHSHQDHVGAFRGIAKITISCTPIR